MPVSDRVHKDMHMRIHTREQPYTLSSHMLGHVGETPHIYTCTVLIFDYVRDPRIPAIYLSAEMSAVTRNCGDRHRDHRDPPRCHRD